MKYFFITLFFLSITCFTSFDGSILEGRTYKLMARCTNQCNYEQNRNCTGRCIQFSPTRQQSPYVDEMVAQKCWDVDDCAQFPALYQFKQCGECQDNCAVFHGVTVSGWSYIPILSCFNEFKENQMPNGCELQGKIYLFAWIYIFITLLGII